MRLIYSPINCAYFFVFGESPIRLEGDYLMFSSRTDAVEAARQKGLRVDRAGRVSIIKVES